MREISIELIQRLSNAIEDFNIECSFSLKKNKSLFVVAFRIRSHDLTYDVIANRPLVVASSDPASIECDPPYDAQILCQLTSRKH